LGRDADRSRRRLRPRVVGHRRGRLVDRVRREKRPGDVVLRSIHWGSNWGYDVTDDQVRFAHRLVDGGVDLVHGHSSHHPRPIEVHRGKLVLYGCGDLINDYDGISGHEEFRPDLRLLYFAALEPPPGRSSTCGSCRCRRAGCGCAPRRARTASGCATSSIA
jgi:poly-gamma-glutamate synthesis protein (capsule biosynthesis protein)